MTKLNQHILFLIALLFITAVAMFATAANNIIIFVVLIILPIVVTIVYKIFKNPIFGIWTLMIYGFIVGAASKMTEFPAGTLVDLLVFLIFIAAIAQKNVEWKRLNNTTFFIIFIWFIYTVLELINPLAPTYIAWFYAVRTMSIQILLISTISFLIFDKKYFYTFIKIWFVFSILATLYGFLQKYKFPNLFEFEKLWLARGYYKQHILFGVLRVFSFYTDSGQFGAAEAHTLTASIILLINEKRKRRIILYLSTAILSFLGMMISGTRGAIFIPFVGLFAYLIISKNWKIITLGIAALGIVYYFLAFTYIGQSVYEIRRMRTAVHFTQDPSFQTRLNNQKILSIYMKDKPFGAGIGTSQYWGAQFSPNTYLAHVPTDSLYVQIWVETGIVGVFIWLILILWITFRGGYLINITKDQELKTQLIAVWAGLLGIFVANYGNAIMTQFPTLVVSYLSIGYIFRIESEIIKTK